MTWARGSQRLFRPVSPAVEMVHFGGAPAIEMVVHFEASLASSMYCRTVWRWILSSRAMRRIDQPCAAKLAIACCWCTESMLAITAAHPPGFARQRAAFWPFLQVVHFEALH